MKNFIAKGEVLTLTAPTGGLVAGKLTKFGNLFVVPVSDAETGQAVACHWTGIFKFEKVPADAPAQLGKAYLKSDGNITTTATGNAHCGFFTSEAANGDTHAEVLLGSVTG